MWYLGGKAAELLISSLFSDSHIFLLGDVTESPKTVLLFDGSQTKSGYQPQRTEGGLWMRYGGFACLEKPGVCAHPNLENNSSRTDNSPTAAVTTASHRFHVKQQLLDAIQCPELNCRSINSSSKGVLAQCLHVFKEQTCFSPSFTCKLPSQVHHLSVRAMPTQWGFGCRPALLKSCKQANRNMLLRCQIQWHPAISFIYYQLCVQIQSMHRIHECAMAQNIYLW